MKIRMYLLLFACLCMAGMSFAANIDLDDDEGDGGKGKNPRIRMMAVPLVQAEYTDNSEVIVDFLADFGNVNVTITDDYGRVYRTVSVNTSLQGNLIVDVTSLDAGEYILKVKSESGSLSKSGRFAVD